MSKTKVTLVGATGTMGSQVVAELLRRPDCELTVLVLEREKGREPARRLVRWEKAGRLRIVWGDATRAEDAAAAIRGAEVVFNTMACISPMADYYPEVARQVNVDAVANLLRAIAAEPQGAERIRYVHTGTVAATGNRPPGCHVGRVGDPLKPSVFDSYALTKIEGERLVLESGLKRWAVLRMSFIMPTTFARQRALNDAIAYHMPLDTHMENLSDRDAGFGMANILNLPDESDFWGRVYNMGGGPGMRCTAEEFLDATYGLLGLQPRACYDPSWYAERNFHLQFYEDSSVLNGYLHFWRDTNATYLKALNDTLPAGLRVVRALSRWFPPVRKAVEAAAFGESLKVATSHRNSPLFWKTQGNLPRLSAFFYPPGTRFVSGTTIRLAHGFDESKPVLRLADLQEAARFRGGACLADDWSGDESLVVAWRCAAGHPFDARPTTVLRAGHWCPTCVARWNQDEQAKVNPFFAQVWYADHDLGENNTYPASCGDDIRGADRYLLASTKTVLSATSIASLTFSE